VDVEVVSILTAIRIRSVKADYLSCYEYYYNYNETGKCILFQEKWHCISQWKYRFLKTRNYVYMTIRVYRRTLEKLLRTRRLCDTAMFLFHFAVKGD